MVTDRVRFCVILCLFHEDEINFLAISLSKIPDAKVFV